MIFIRFFVVLMVVIGTYYGLQWLQQNELGANVQSVRLEGEFLYTEKDDLAETIADVIRKAPQPNQLQVIRSTLLDRPGVKTVEIRRTWPSGIIIRYMERQPLALWNGDQVILDDFSLLNSEASSKYKAVAQLPMVQGEEGRHVTAMVTFSKVTNAIKSEPIKRFVENGAQGGRVQFENGVTADLGMTDFDRRIYRLARLIDNRDFWRKIAGGAVVDLRYDDGFTLNMPLLAEQEENHGET